MTRNKKYAVTGGIGSGKSAFCQEIKKLGYPVFSCDEIYAELCRDKNYLSRLKELFPDCFCGETLTRAALAQKVFSDEEALKKLNALAHPLIMERLYAEMQKHPLSFAEVPLLYEGGYEKDFDGVIVLRRKKEERVRSVMARDGLSEAEIRARMARQTEEIRHNCILVENDGDLKALRQKAQEAIRRLQQ